MTIKMSNSDRRRNLKNSFSDKNNDSIRQKLLESNNLSSHLLNVPEAKWIHVYINGDEHFPGYRCVVNSRHYRNLDMFLNFLTERLKPSFGAVRNIYTPVNGLPVQSLEDLISNHQYVVAGSERFKKIDLGYVNVGNKKYKRSGWKPKNNIKISKAKSTFHSALTLFFNLNGAFKMKPTKVKFVPQDLDSWESLFRKLQNVFDCGSVKRLYSLNGKPIQNIEELTNYQSYVLVCKHEVFKAGHYITPSPKALSSSKEKPYAYTSRKSSSVITSRSSAIHSRTSAQLLSFEISPPAQRSAINSLKDVTVDNSLTVIEPGNGADNFESSYSFSKEKSMYVKDNSITKYKIDLDDDTSGIYRSKTKNCFTADAAEVEDGPETVIDLPIDLLEAEEVEDELTPDVERSLQHLTLDPSEEIVALLPTVQQKHSSSNNPLSANKYDLANSQTVDMQNILV